VEGCSGGGGEAELWQDALEVVVVIGRLGYVIEIRMGN